MRKRIGILLLLGTCMLGACGENTAGETATANTELTESVSGDGAVLNMPIDSNETQKKYKSKYDFIHEGYADRNSFIAELRQACGDENGDFSDFTVMTAEESDGEYHPEDALANMYLNPYASGEVVDYYLKLVQSMDTYMQTVGNYAENVKAEMVPYYVEFIIDQYTVFSVNLDGQIDYDMLRTRIEGCLTWRLEEYAASDASYTERIKADDLIKTDAEGQYYYVLDAGDFDTSINKIIKSAKDIRQYSPISQRTTYRLKSSVTIMGEYPGPNYTIYLNEYGGEKVPNALLNKAFCSDALYCFGVCDSAETAYLSCYEYLIREAEHEAENPSVQVSLNYREQPNGTPDNEVYISLDLYEGRNTEFVTEVAEEALQGLYDRYAALYEAYKEHGINPDYKHYIYAKWETEEAASYWVKQSVPMDRLLSYEEFKTLWEEGIRPYGEV